MPNHIHVGAPTDKTECLRRRKALFLWDPFSQTMFKRSKRPYPPQRQYWKRTSIHTFAALDTQTNHAQLPPTNTNHRNMAGCRRGKGETFVFRQGVPSLSNVSKNTLLNKITTLSPNISSNTSSNRLSQSSAKDYPNRNEGQRNFLTNLKGIVTKTKVSIHGKDLAF